MSDKKYTDEKFMEIFQAYGPTVAARKLGMSVRNVHSARRRIERTHDIMLVSPVGQGGAPVIRTNLDVPQRIETDISDGIVLIASDSHYWPNYITTAHKAFVKFCKKFKPKVIVKNGDVVDGAAISRHPPIGWDRIPSINDEIKCSQERLSEIRKASPNSKLIWPLGNHDMRFETKIASNAPEFKNVHGTSLKDHFPEWQSCWSFWINDDVVIKHRFKGGIHAAHNNTLWAGKTIITGHLHRLTVRPLDDYNGRRWGCETGTLAEPYGPQFADYTEDNPRNHQSGFLFLTFRAGRLMWPEVVAVIGEDRVEFRGDIIDV